MSEHPIQSLMDTTLQKIRDMVDVNTIIGDQICTTDGTVIIPVSKVTMGFASGGSDIGTKTSKEMFGGGGGAGVTINPVAFIAVSNGNVKLLQLGAGTGAGDKAVALVPEMFDKIAALFNKDKKHDKCDKDDKCEKHEKCEKQEKSADQTETTETTEITEIKHCCVDKEDD